MPVGEYGGDTGERSIMRSFVLALTPGSVLLEELSNWATQRSIVAASVSGIGSFDDAVFGYWDKSKKDFSRLTAHGFSEIASLQGTVGLVRGERTPAIHLHGTVCRNDFRIVGGHLLAATVGATVELIITELGSFPLARLESSPIDGIAALAIRDAALSSI